MNVKTNTTNTGTVVSVRGSVVDIRFDGHLPPIYSALRANHENSHKALRIPQNEKARSACL